MVDHLRELPLEVFHNIVGFLGGLDKENVRNHLQREWRYQYCEFGRWRPLSVDDGIISGSYWVQNRDQHGDYEDNGPIGRWISTYQTIETANGFRDKEKIQQAYVKGFVRTLVSSDIPFMIDLPSVVRQLRTRIFCYRQYSNPQYSNDNDKKEENEEDGQVMFVDYLKQFLSRSSYLDDLARYWHPDVLGMKTHRGFMLQHLDNFIKGYPSVLFEKDIFKKFQHVCRDHLGFRGFSRRDSEDLWTFIGPCFSSPSLNFVDQMRRWIMGKNYTTDDHLHHTATTTITTTTLLSIPEWPETIEPIVNLMDQCRDLSWGEISVIQRCNNPFYSALRYHRTNLRHRPVVYDWQKPLFRNGASERVQNDLYYNTDFMKHLYANSYGEVMRFFDHRYKGRWIVPVSYLVAWGASMDLLNSPLWSLPSDERVDYFSHLRYFIEDFIQLDDIDNFSVHFLRSEELETFTFSKTEDVEFIRQWVEKTIRHTHKFL